MTSSKFALNTAFLSGLIDGQISQISTSRARSITISSSEVSEHSEESDIRSLTNSEQYLNYDRLTKRSDEM